MTGSNFETAIQGMMEMGFPREECMLAMRASFNNPDRAVEYLMTVCELHDMISCLVERIIGSLC